MLEQMFNLRIEFQYYTNNILLDETIFNQIPKFNLECISVAEWVDINLIRQILTKGL